MRLTQHSNQDQVYSMQPVCHNNNNKRFVVDSFKMAEERITRRTKREYGEQSSKLLLTAHNTQLPQHVLTF